MSMRLLFFSSDHLETERTARDLSEAGIPCLVQSSAIEGGTPSEPPCSELWIQNEADRHRASMLCVELRVGFAKPATDSGFRFWIDADS